MANWHVACIIVVRSFFGWGTESPNLKLDKFIAFSLKLSNLMPAKFSCCTVYCCYKLFTNSFHTWKVVKCHWARAMIYSLGILMGGMNMLGAGYPAWMPCVCPIALMVFVEWQMSSPFWRSHMLCRTICMGQGKPRRLGGQDQPLC